MEIAKRPRSSNLEGEVDASLKRLRMVKRQELELDNKSKSIDDEMEALRDKRRENALKMRDLQLGPMKEALDSYSRSITLAFMAKIQSTLPIELRNMVYKELWELMVSPQSIVSRFMIEDLLNGRVRDCSLHSHDRHERLPTFIDPAFCGPAIAREIVEALYTSGVLETSPPLAVVREIHQIETIVCKDVFRVGLDPATVLRGLNINLDIEQCLSEEATEAPFVLERWVQDSFNLLLRIRNKLRFRLRIVLSQRYIRLKVLEEFLHLLTPTIAAFKEEGADVAVRFCYRPYSGLIPPERSLADAISTPKGNWKEDMIEWLEGEECIQEHHREYLHEEHPGFVPPACYPMDSDWEDHSDLADEFHLGEEVWDEDHFDEDHFYEDPFRDDNFDDDLEGLDLEALLPAW